MSAERFPRLNPDDIRQTRDALHAYSRILGDWLKSARPPRKHWWHASLRPSLTGLTTGVIVSNVDFEIEINLRESVLSAQTATGEEMQQTLQGQPAEELASQVQNFLHEAGVLASPPKANAALADAGEFSAYSAEEANKLARALAAVSGAMSDFRASLRAESSPIQVWPHHFDLSMIWLPGEKIPGQDPAKEEYADKQMNFGFVFGDESFAEPYFYVTAYPLPDAMPQIELPDGTTWKSDGFSGAVLLYRDLVAMQDPAAYLQELWSTLRNAGQKYLASNE